MAQLMACPDEATFQKLMLAEASDEALEAFAEHMSHCSACAEAVERALAGDTLANAVRSQTTLGETPKPPAPLLQQLLRLGQPDGQRSTPSDAAVLDPAAHAAAACVSFDFLAPPQAADEIGRLGGYRVLKLLGTGGMGLVFQAEDLRLRRMVALKVMKPKAVVKPDARERFLREAQAAAAIEHEHIVTIHHVGEDRGVPFLAMQWLKGMSLDDLLKKEGTLPTPQVRRIGRQIALGLAAAHEQGLIHRDIKPANIWLETPTGEPGGVSHGRVKLLDFGLARAQADEEHLTQSGAILGTPAYMAPEQARGEKIDHRCDLFSLGVVLYCMATGQLPFRGGNTLAVLSSLAVDTPAPPHALNANCPEELSQLIMSLLEKDPAKRPASAREVVAALDRLDRAAPAADAAAMIDPQTVIDEPKAATAPAPVLSPAPHKPRRRWPLAIAAGLLFLIGGGLLMQQIFLRITDKDGKTRDIELKPGDRIEIVEKPAPVETPPKPTPEVKVIAGDPDRSAAEYVLSIGGTVRINDEERYITTAANLPKEPFQLTAVSLGRNPQVTDAGLAHFKDCKNLTQLNLDGTQLTDAGLAHFKDCQNLGQLTLGYTQVTDAGLAYFKDCKNLTYLNLDGTEVTDAGLAHFKDCKNLSHLYLTDTRVTDAGLAHFKDCNRLMLLKLDGTRVTGVGLASFKDCKNLTQLNLDGTQVSDVGLAYFKDCKNLTVLCLSSRQVTDVGLASFKDCKNLSHLNLNGTRVTDAGLAHFKGCKNLTQLHLYDTQVSDVGLASFKDCKNLTVLYLGSRQVTDVGLASFKDCKNLTQLNLDGTQVTDAGLAHFKDCKNLSGLYLTDTQVTDAGLAHFKDCNRLTVIKLDGTRVTDATLGFLAVQPLQILYLRDARISRYGYDQLKAAFPKVDIQWSEPNRRATEQVLALGGTVEISEPDKAPRPLKQGEALPEKFFQLRRVVLKDCQQPPGELINTLARLQFPETDRLEAIDLSGTPLTDVGFLASIHGLRDLALARCGLNDNHLAQLPKVQRLVLDGNVFSASGLQELAKRTELTDLSLAGAGVSDLTVANLAGLKGLKRLSLANTGLSDAGLKHLEGLAALEHLDLSGTKVTADGVAALKQALPKCEVTRDP
jgi:Leucine-rich repeat (LRR) protein